MSGIGHNRPPANLAMKEFVDAKQERRDEIIAAICRKQVSDRATCGDASDLISIAKKFGKLIEDERKSLTDPLREEAERTKAVADAFLEDLAEAMESLQRRVNKWTAEEDARIAAQKAEQEAELAAMRAKRIIDPDLERRADELSPFPPFRQSSDNQRAEVKPTRRRPIRGDMGGKVTSAAVVTWTVDDVRAVPDWILNTPTVHDAIAAVAKSMSKHHKQIPGLTRHENTENRFR